MRPQLQQWGSQEADGLLKFRSNHDWSKNSIVSKSVSMVSTNLEFGNVAFADAVEHGVGEVTPCKVIIYKAEGCLCRGR